METISQVLFWVANSLLIPDILLLLLLFIRGCWQRSKLQQRYRGYHER